MEFRVRNLLKKGDAFTKGDTPVDCDLETGLRRTAKALGWGEKKGPNRGMGLACCMKDGGGTYKVASAAIKLNSDGSAVLFTGTVEIGQGCRTALAQVAAEELSLPYEAVTVAQLDTDSTPYDAATNASSSMVIMGLCVVRAAAELKRQLRQAAAKLFKCKADKITFKNGHVSAGKGKRLSYEQVLNRKFGAKGGELLAKGTYQDVHSKKAVLGSPTTFWETSWGGAEVEVDPDTGVVKLLKYISTADVGKAIHPLQCEGQDEGAVMFAIGHSLMEEMQYDNGHLLNPNLIDYRLPSFTDIPGTFETILIEDGNGPGPYGAKGLGEGGLMPVAPASATPSKTPSACACESFPSPRRGCGGRCGRTGSGRKRGIVHEFGCAETTMFKRLHVDNYKCLVNFDLAFQDMTLLLGRNGTGKTSILDIIYALRELLSGTARIADPGIFPSHTLTAWQTRELQIF